MEGWGVIDVFDAVCDVSTIMSWLAGVLFIGTFVAVWGESMVWRERGE